MIIWALENRDVDRIELEYSIDKGVIMTVSDDTGAVGAQFIVEDFDMLQLWDFVEMWNRAQKAKTVPDPAP